jgi:PAS domain S-box-containing protein
LSQDDYSEVLMSSVIDNMDSGFALHEIIFDEAGNAINSRFLKVNPAYIKLVGVGDPTGKTSQEVHPNLEQGWKDVLGKVARTGVSQSFQQYLGDVGKWWQVYGFKVAENQCACVFHDITELKMAQEKLKVEVGELEERVAGRTSELQEANSKLLDQMLELQEADKALRRSEEMYRLLLANIDLGVTLVDSEHTILFVNEALCRIFGKEKGRFIGSKCYEAYENRDEICSGCPGVEAMETGRTVETETRGIRGDGSIIEIRITRFPVIIGDKGKTDGFIEVIKDISGRKAAEVELHQYEDKLRSLASKLTLSEEHERHRIASGLHDSIIQPLIFLRIKLDSLVNNKSISEQSEGIEGMRRTIADLVKITREFTFDLSYPILYELGLETAIDEWLTEEIQGKYDIKTTFTDDGQSKPLGRDFRSFLFESFRELLVNIIKHAKAANVSVDVSSEDGIIVIVVEDDGVGFDADERLSLISKDSGLGLFSIRERLSYFKGSLEILSSPGNGSKVILRAPLQKGEVDKER